jgi:CelD/BcsL family acetyltransferase involved in cellulose biosynthesis
MENVDESSLMVNAAAFAQPSVQARPTGRDRARASDIGAGGPIAGTSLSLGIAARPEDIEAEWRDLEARAPVSPYQRYDLCAAWARHAAAGAGIEVKIGVVRDKSGRAVLILPFGIARNLGVAAAVYLGGAHFNVNMPLVDPAWTLDAKTAGAILDAYAGAVRADVLLLRNQPRIWQRVLHPFAGLPHDLAPDDIRLVIIEDSYETYLACRLSRKMRSELKRKRIKLSDAGAVTLERATSVEEVDLLLAAFIGQKSKRLVAQGLGDPFVLPGVKAFLRESALAGLGGSGGMEIHAMMVNGKPISVRAGISHGKHLSFMVQSFDTEHQLAKYSPSEFLLNEVMAGASAKGFDSFDFGVGDGRFKQVWSNQMVPLFNIARPLTKKGRLYAGLMRLERAVTRSIKRNPGLFAAVQETRASIARLRALA